MNKHDEETLRQEPIAMLPAWAFEELLARVKHHREERPSLFPEGTPLADVESVFPAYKHLSVQEGVLAAFHGWQSRILGQADDDGFDRPRFRRHKAGPRSRKGIYHHVAIVFDHPEQSRILLRLQREHGMHRSSEVILVRLTCPTAATELAERKLEAIETWVEKNNHLKGHKLDCKGGFLCQDRVYTWDCVFADPNLLQAVRRNTQGFLEKLPQYRRLRLPTHRGVLLHGKPGTGKTLIGKVLCSQVHATFIWVTPGILWHDSSVENVFEMARDLSPTLVFFEDLDLFAPRRKHSPFDSSVLGELMNQLDGLKDNDGIVVVATTNDLDAIEPAIKDRPSRFDCVLEIPDVTDAIRREYLRAFLADRGILETFFDEAERATRQCRTIAEVQEHAIRCLQRAIESGVDPAAIRSTAELPDLLQPPMPTHQTEILGFHPAR